MNPGPGSVAAMTSIQVDPGELGSLSAQLAGIAETSAGIAEEAKALGIGDWQMYGVFISPIACSILAVVDASHTGTFDALAEVNAALDETMVATCQAYAGTEDANATAAVGVSTAVQNGPQP